jgi:hypothetical protein
MPRRPLFKDEVEKVYAELRASRSQPERTVLSETEALAFHKAQGERQALEHARLEYYRTHNSTDGPYPGDE